MKPDLVVGSPLWQTIFISFAVPLNFLGNFISKVPVTSAPETALRAV